MRDNDDVALGANRCDLSKQRLQKATSTIVHISSALTVRKSVIKPADFATVLHDIFHVMWILQITPFLLTESHIYLHLPGLKWLEGRAGTAREGKFRVHLVLALIEAFGNPSKGLHGSAVLM